MRQLRTLFSGFDPALFGATLALTAMGLVTMYSHTGENFYFERQLWWIALAFIGMCVALVPDYRFLRTGNIPLALYLLSIASLVAVLLFGEVTLGAQNRFDLGLFSLQPADPAKFLLIIVLAKYFAKRHELIGDFTHILVSGAYAGFMFFLLFLQPDLGLGLIVFLTWLGIIMVAGIKIRHLLVVFAIGTLVTAFLWRFVFFDYQQQRILTFLNPLADVRGAGYSAYQSTVAVGSGELFGKGIGHGTQSKLLFLPEYQTDFIFAAFAEEWGFAGVVLLFALFSVVVWRLIAHARAGATNFEKLFAVGVAVVLISHFFIHIGMNIGLLPVTGLTIPFLSYGGSHLITSYIALGMVMAMRRYAPVRIRADDARLEIIQNSNLKSQSDN
jgi:rod shape determining protein RodA